MQKNKKKTEGRKYITTNKKAFHDYTILERFEAGISLTGTEVKSCMENGVNLKDSYACIRNGQLTLVGAHIAPYSQGNIENHDPDQPRILLMHKREITRLKKSVEAKGFTLIALSMYFSPSHKIKVELALCRGKNVRDKREDMKKAIDVMETKRMMSGKGKL